MKKHLSLHLEVVHSWMCYKLCRFDLIRLLDWLVLPSPVTETKCWNAVYYTFLNTPNYTIIFTNLFFQIIIPSFITQQNPSFSGTAFSATCKTWIFGSCVLQDQWGHVEEIELVNDGSGLGFGIVGGKMTGVVVRTIVPNSVADRVSPTQTWRRLTGDFE